MQSSALLSSIYAVRTVYYRKLRRIVEMSEQRSVPIVIFLTLRVFAEIVCLFLQFRTIVCLFLRCHCCETAENAFETLKWFAEPMILTVNRILTRRSIMTQKIEIKKNKKNKKKFWILKFKKFLKSSGFAKSKRIAKFKRICKIQKNLQNPKEFAESERICKIQKDLRNSKKFAKFKKICRKFSSYKLILLLTKKKANRR